MLLISWNVAGWSSTAAAIRESYGSIEYFFELTGADIICIQECKGTWAKLEADAVTMGASDPPAKKRKRVEPVAAIAVEGCEDAGAPVTGGVRRTATGSAAVPSTGGVDGWESLWALSAPAQRGFNGVVTFARRGLVWRCDNAPFAVPEFNEEGRVIVTHFSAFVVVNVYVPNARGGERSAFKLRFLRSLQAHMDKLRKETGKPVVLVGDLNLTYRPVDATWGLQRIPIGELMQLNALADGTTDGAWSEVYPHLSKATLRRLSNAVANVLCRELGSLVVSLDKRAESSASAKAAPGAGVVSVDSATESPDGSLQLEKARGLLERVTVADERYSAQYLAAIPTAMNFVDPVASLAELHECGFRSAFLDDLVSNVQPSHNRDLFTLTQACGLPPHGKDSARFMSCLLHETCWRCDTDPALDDLPELERSPTKMWDTFLLSEATVEAARRHYEGAQECKADELQSCGVNTSYCPCPHTCWDQSRNRRMKNEGTRLDYVLVDTELVRFVNPRQNTVNNTGFSLASKAASSPLPNVDQSTGSGILASQPSLSGLAEADFFAAFSGSARTDSVRRAMADGLFPAAPHDRSGLPPLQDSARGCCFAGLPSTGLFVTPPQFSDHIGVSLDFRGGAGGLRLEQRTGKLIEDSGKCMYRPPVGLHAFFGIGAAVKRPATASARDSAAPKNQSAKVEPDTKPAAPATTAVIEVVDVLDVDDA